MPPFLRKLWFLLSPVSKSRLWLLLLVLIIASLLDALGVALLMPFMALAMDPRIIYTNKWLSLAYETLGFDNATSFLTFVGISVLILLVITNAFRAFSSWAAMRYQYRVLRELRRAMLASFMVRPYEFFLNANTSELSNAVISEADIVIKGVFRALLDVASGLLLCLVLMGFLLAMDPVVAVAVALVFAGAYVGLYFTLRRVLVDVGNSLLASSSEMFRTVYESTGGIKELKVLGRELTFLERFSRAAVKQSEGYALSNVLLQIPKFGLETVAFGGLLLVVIFYVHQGRQAVDVIPILSVYVFAGYKLLPTFHNIFNAIASLRTNVQALHRTYSGISEYSRSLGESEHILGASSEAPPAVFRTSLELQNIVFQYEGAPRPSVDGLNLVVPAGAVVGLVGPTGCGKTTTADIVLGLLRPKSGKMLVDGLEIPDAARANWRRLLGYVPQNLYISDDTVARNIAFGVADSNIDMVAVRNAAAIANISDFIEKSMPQGYDTRIGERGVRLSGGQRQRIGIARAMYSDPAVLIMDEATSALDGLTEEAVMEAVRALSRHKTIILIAHRLTTVQECDIIYQLGDGAVVASGTYDELVQGSEWFRSVSREVT